MFLQSALYRDIHRYTHIYTYIYRFDLVFLGGGFLYLFPDTLEKSFCRNTADLLVWFGTTVSELRTPQTQTGRSPTRGSANGTQIVTKWSLSELQSLETSTAGAAVRTVVLPPSFPFKEVTNAKLRRNPNSCVLRYQRLYWPRGRLWNLQCNWNYFLLISKRYWELKSLAAVPLVYGGMGWGTGSSALMVKLHELNLTQERTKGYFTP